MKVQRNDSVNNQNEHIVIKMRLTTKLILLTVLTLAAAIITMGILVVNTGAAIIDQATEADALEYGEESARHIGAVITGNLETLNEIAVRERTASMDFGIQVASITGDVERLGYQDMAVIETNGHGKYIVGGGEFDVLNEIWYQEALKGKPYVSDVSISQVTKQPAVFEVAPIKKENQVVGVLLGRRDPTFLNAITNTLGDGKIKYGYVISANGTIMAHPSEQLVLDQSNVFDNMEKDGPQGFAAMFKALDSNEVADFEYEYDGDTKLAFVAPIQETDWTLVITESKTAMLAPIVQLRNTIIMFALVILVVGAVVSYIISRRIAKPVMAANLLIKEINAGHLSDRLPIVSKDEVGELTQSLNQMADNLQNTIISLMRKISNGDVSTDLVVVDPQDEITPVLKQTVETIRALIGEATMLSHAALAGQWATRGDETAFEGGFKEIVQGVNATLDTVVDKMVWYEAIIDSVPFPLHVTDNDMKWAFMNKAFEDLMIDSKVIKDRKVAIGMDCFNAGASICQTENCGIRQLVDHGNGESFFEWYGRNNKQDTAYLKNAKGENVGFVEIITDLTPMIRVSNYTSHEVARLANNLTCLSQGNLNFDLQIGAADEYTSEVSAQFAEIHNSLSDVKDSVDKLIADATMLARAGIEGELNTRADASLHQGDFAKIIDGVNATLDAVVAPVQEASATLKELAQGNLDTGMVGNYNGDYTQIKDDMNQTVVFLKRYVDEIADTLKEVGEGNLDLEITGEYLGDFQAIKTALNEITNKLSTTMADINEAATQVEAGAIQISDGGQALSQGTTEQASSIQELTASIEEVARETKQNAQNANNANELATEVKTNAEVGNVQMAEMVTAMIDINEASSNISKIIKVIDDIAFQTNILALNAAVEAARAGQHGKGFAVVAEEVRTLAARSAEAAKETTTLIEGSISKTEAGSKIADQTADSLKEILNQIEKVTGLVGDIAQASNDQASEIAQINQGIEQVSQVVQTNSATAEESAAASEELSGQAEILKQMVGAFRLKGKSLSSMETAVQSAPKPVSSSQIDILLDEADKY
ncbi:methyl-accepting chemotaxis protein [Acetobacterium sp. KB-1]|jgi:methyl-accepting chemotaxis protein|uniref:methyl-accepting chemotaxis protein n=1 Tax=Acetobacterium sp. KB-1 TaxID=2184575 RepID=UPI000DBEC3DD|nr:methyl-accepting chemotaxis protein [Acetobacterium sp. KB-1]AWW26105.1 methyl-accepting chemotaxis protein [Acetobacterium sp. KB-1]